MRGSLQSYVRPDTVVSVSERLSLIMSSTGRPSSWRFLSLLSWLAQNW
jgi:hypothetical protein